MYNWTEQEVSSEVQRVKCVYGPQVMTGVGMAERRCASNLFWIDYDGSTCATFDTAELRRLAGVSFSHCRINMRQLLSVHLIFFHRLW